MMKTVFDSIITILSSTIYWPPAQLVIPNQKSDQQDSHPAQYERVSMILDIELNWIGAVSNWVLLYTRVDTLLRLKNI